MGVDAFSLKGYKKYSKELKLQAVLDYLDGNGSQADICKKYEIPSKAKLQNWIKKYNGREELRSSGTVGTIIMTKGRKPHLKNELKLYSTISHMTIIMPKQQKNIMCLIGRPATIP